MDALPSDDWAPTTLHQLSDNAVTSFGAKKVAFIYTEEGLGLTLGELQERSMIWARALASAGVNKGDRVAIFLQGNSLWPILQVACSRIGAVMVGINTRYRSQEIEHLLSLVQPKIVITQPQWRDIKFSTLLSESLSALSS